MFAGPEDDKALNKKTTEAFLQSANVSLKLENLRELEGVCDALMSEEFMGRGRLEIVTGNQLRSTLAQNPEVLVEGATVGLQRLEASCSFRLGWSGIPITVTTLSRWRRSLA